MLQIDDGAAEANGLPTKATHEYCCSMKLAPVMVILQPAYAVAGANDAIEGAATTVRGDIVRGEE